MDRLARSARSARGEDRRGPCNCEEHSEDSLGEHKHPCDLPRRRRTKTRAPGQESRPAVPPRLHLLGSRVVGRRDPRPGQPRWRSVVGSVPTPIGRMSVSHGEGRGRVEPNGPTAHNDHTTSTRGRRLPIRRSHPGPIVRAGVVSLWALERHWRKPTPRGRADDPACRVQSGREETAPPPPRQSGLCGRDAPLIGQPNLGLWRSGKARVWIGCRRSASNDTVRITPRSRSAPMGAGWSSASNAGARPGKMGCRLGSGCPFGPESRQTCCRENHAATVNRRAVSKSRAARVAS